jgi:hypothetical protein
MNAQGGENVEGYTLENVELEYESIDNIGLARKVESQYNVGRKLFRTRHPDEKDGME